ncbi:DUF7288 family protein [Halarchaeum sp. P4]|uniref:DUF7288 family protein n=1 Tax=Halarchaeum sp. P4 TaxID=3421639 RepID=UPI003EC07863
MVTPRERGQGDGSDRGQAHTLEGVTAALIVVTSVVLALQMTAVTPLTASTANQHIETQERAAAHGVLATASQETLRGSALYWNATRARFPGSGERGFYVGSGPTEQVALLDRLNQTFYGTGIAYNVRLVYLDAAGEERRTRRLVYNGEPTENAVIVRRSVTLYDNDHPVVASGRTPRTLGESAYFAPDAAPNSTVYNVVDVEVVVWRM